MNISELKRLVLGGESETLEFKKSTAQLRSACETICAFLNGQGGLLLFGVADNGKIIGQKISDATKREVAKEIAKIEPAPQVNISYIPLEKDKLVIVLRVQRGNHLPYIYDGRAFQRNQSTTQRMSQHRYEQLIVERGQLNYSWEETVDSTYTLNDLDHEEIYRTVMDGISEKRIPASIAKEEPEKILRQLNLISDGKLKRAAVVLFAKEIHSGYLQCWLKMARFRGVNKANNFIDNQQIHCNVFRMLEEVDHFLNRHLPVASYFKPDEWQRIDKPALPILAVREALVNAICHRSYENQSGYISIAIYDDRLEIWNNGILPKELKISDLKKKHDSVLRNKLIANVFYLRGYIEAWGTGTITMNDLCKESGIPSVKFSERTGGLVVIFKFAEPLGSHAKIKKSELTSRQYEILNLLKQSSMNGAQLAESLSDKVSVRTIQNDLSFLEKLNLIERKGKARSIMWNIVKEK